MNSSTKEIFVAEIPMGCNVYTKKAPAEADA
jgi:hypothetical protein